MRAPEHQEPNEAGAAGISWLLGPKLRAARRRVAEGRTVSRVVVLGGVGIVFWAALFQVLYRLLRYFQGVEGFGDLLAAKLLGLILLAFLAVLLLSNVITALSTFFLADDLDLLLAAPVESPRVYAARLLETLAHSSWMVVLVTVPVLVAYGWVFGGGLTFATVAVVTLAAFLVLPAVAGSGLTLLLVNVFPARRARDFLALIALAGAGAVILMLRLLRPEQLASPEGFRHLAEYFAMLRTPSSVWLPSEWAAAAMMASLQGDGWGMDLFPLLLLCSTAAVAVLGGAWLHSRLFRQGYSRAQQGAEGRGRGRRAFLDRLFKRLPPSARVVVTKDVLTFFRDTTQWSQLILLGVLMVIYTYNIRALPLHTGEPVGFFLVNLVGFLNIGLAGFVLAAIAARFVFPAVSLEGRTLWLLRSSPLDARLLVWSKFWVGVLPLLLLALVLAGVTGWILAVGPLMLLLSLSTITILTFAITALALCFGAMFPRFETENAAQIPTGFGGMLFMMAAIILLVLVVGFQAWPVHGFMSARLAGETMTGGPLLRLGIGLGLAFGIGLATTVVALRMALRRVEAL